MLTPVPGVVHRFLFDSIYCMHTEERFNKIIDSYLAGTCSAAEKKIIEEWFDKGIDTGNPDLQLPLAARHRLLKNIHGRLEVPRQVFSLRYRWLAAAVCAGLLVMAGLGLWRKSTESASPELVTVRTEKGQVKRIVLPDGSVVWVNANSILSYRADFTGHRQVQLSGEAMFDVAPDKLHPFLVRTPDSVHINVLGTVFNISSYNGLEETHITVLSGKVEVSKGSVSAGTLTRQQGASYNRGTGVFSRSAEQAMETMAWTKQEWDYNNMHVQDLCLLLENQYGVTVRNNHTRKEALQTGVNVNFSNRQQAEDIVNTFCALAGCRYKKLSKTVFEIY